MSSSRLPGKALLPIGGQPSVILAASRASNRGGNVRIITSLDPSDDVLAETCGTHGFEVFRGELDDVLARTVAALVALPDDALAVRLTADNTLPDQTLIESMAASLVQRKLEYVGICWPGDGLPYGLSLEVFRIGALRRANAETDSAFDREHTTPWLRRNCRAGSWPGLTSVNLARLRCTIDTFDDYLLMQRVFSSVADPVNASWRDLVHVLERMPGAPAALLHRHAYFGASSNAAGGLWISHAVVDASATAPLAGSRTIALLRDAIAHGTTHVLVDVADSVTPQLVGQALAQGWLGRVGIIARLPAMHQDCRVSNMERDVLRLCRSLGITVLDAILVPAGYEPAVWSAAQAMKTLGLVRYVGLWGADLDPAHSSAEIVLDRTPPTDLIPALGSYGKHRVIALSGDLAWTSLK